MDHRDVASHYRGILREISEKHMNAFFVAEDASGEETEHQVNLKFEVCGTCDGRGSHVNPGVDSHGLTAEDFAEDPDFAADYRSGAYDVPCAECKGKRVVPTVDEDTTPKEIVALYQQLEADAWQSASNTAREREMGY